VRTYINKFVSDAMAEFKLVIVKKGECHHCGYCCQGCPHLMPKWEGVKPWFYNCEIYDTRNDYCEKCSMAHTCQDSDYPEFPLRFINPYCGYRFYEQKSGAEIIRLVTPNWDWLSEHGNK